MSGHPVSIVDRCKIAEKLFGVVEWKSATVGFLVCPGEALHTKPGGRKHCRITLDKVPTIYCLHSSCAEAVATANHNLRSAIGTAESGGKVKIKQRELTPEEVMRKHERESAARLEARAAASLPDILKGWAWNPQDACVESPITSEAVEQDWRLVFSMFEPDDLIWSGAEYDSGKPEHATHFRTASEWGKCKTAPGQLTCPSTFKPGTISRCNEAVALRRFLVVESDSLTKDEICSVFRWCQQFLRLRAIVDTAGKSLHGWFDFPPENILAELKIILPALGCDPALFRPAQPCRLPGARREEKWQSLIWFWGSR